jgi:tRNA(Ile)-lysidine synthase
VEAFERVARPAGPGEVSFDRLAWRALPTGLQRATVRLAVQGLRRTLRNLNWEHVERAVETGRRGETGDSATIAAGLALFVDYDELRVRPEGRPAILCALQRPQLTRELPLTAPGETELPGGWRAEVLLLDRLDLPLRYEDNEDPWTAYLDARAVGNNLQLRPRAPGDRFKPLGLAGHSARVNEFMINLKIPAAERGDWPLLAGAGGIAWVCGLRLDEAAAVGPTTERVWRVRFRR